MTSYPHDRRWNSSRFSYRLVVSDCWKFDRSSLRISSVHDVNDDIVFLGFFVSHVPKIVDNEQGITIKNDLRLLARQDQRSRCSSSVDDVNKDETSRCSARSVPDEDDSEFVRMERRREAR